MTAREDELLRQVESVIAETRRDAERVAREDAVRDAARATAARRGELGPDWREVQARIDAGQTTLAAVFTGADESPAAVRLRDRSRSHLEVLARDLPEQVAEDVAAVRASLPGEPS